MQLVLYSLRRGGATHDYLTHHDVARSLFRGRWQQVSTAKLYIAEGAAQLAANRLPPQLQASLNGWAEITRATVAGWKCELKAAGYLEV